MSSDSLKIIKGLAQAAANAYDGALDSEGQPLKIGLRREEGHVIHDSRMLDGFKVNFVGPCMVIKYHSEIKLKEVYRGGFESEVEQRIEDIASFLKKEYRKITGESVSFRPDGEVTATVQNTSRVRFWVQAHRKYIISNLEGVEPIQEPSPGDIEDGFRSFLEQGGFQGTRPENDSRKTDA